MPQIGSELLLMKKLAPHLHLFKENHKLNTTEEIFLNTAVTLCSSDLPLNHSTTWQYGNGKLL